MQAYRCLTGCSAPRRFVANEVAVHCNGTLAYPDLSTQLEDGKPEGDGTMFVSSDGFLTCIVCITDKRSIHHMGKKSFEL